MLWQEGKIKHAIFCSDLCNSCLYMLWQEGKIEQALYIYILNTNWNNKIDDTLSFIQLFHAKII